jgi:peptidoglycan/xylan/chitin deacetylase (PgdA/CDA1 family)
VTIVARRIAREAFGHAIRWSGAPWLVRRTVARGRVGIVLYHDPPSETIERHLAYLTERFDVISLDRLVDVVRTGDWSSITRPSIVITIDDGHRGNLALRSVFAKFGVVPTLYVCPEISSGDGVFWFALPGVDPEPLKRVSDDERLTRVAAQARPLRQALTPEEVRSIGADFDVQSHTLSHPILPRTSDETCRREVTDSRTAVEALTGKPCVHFSFPNGDYGERELAFVASAGYLSARTADIGWNGPGTNPYRLRITAIADHASVDLLAAHLSGLLVAKRLVDRARAAISR